jgi:hypothetical protein
MTPADKMTLLLAVYQSLVNEKQPGGEKGRFISESKLQTIIEKNLKSMGFNIAGYNKVSQAKPAAEVLKLVKQHGSLMSPNDEQLNMLIRIGSFGKGPESLARMTIIEKLERYIANRKHSAYGKTKTAYLGTTKGRSDNIAIAYGLKEELKKVEAGDSTKTGFQILSDQEVFISPLRIQNQRYGRLHSIHSSELRDIIREIDALGKAPEKSQELVRK